MILILFIVAALVGVLLGVYGFFWKLWCLTVCPLFGWQQPSFVDFAVLSIAAVLLIGGIVGLLVPKRRKGAK